MNPTFLTIAQQGRNGWKRYLIGILVTFSVAIIIMVPLLFITAYVSGISINNPNASDLILKGNPIRSIVFFGLTFIGFLLGLFLAVTRVHKRKFMTLVSPDSTIDWFRMLKGFIVWLGLRSISFFVWYLISPSLFSWTFNLSEWLPFAFVALAFVPIISLSANTFMLGYLLQGLGLVIQRPLLLLIAWGFVFGSLSIIGDRPDYWILTVFYNVFLVWLIFTDNRLELALGLQTAEHLYALIFLSSSNPVIEGPTVFNIFDSTDLLLPALVTNALRAGLFYFIFFGRRRNLPTSIPD